MGDELIATGQARVMQARDPRPVAILDKRGRLRSHPMWENNPRIARARDGNQQCLVNGGGRRPYIDYERSTSERWAWRKFGPPRGELYFTPTEELFGRHRGGFVIVEPGIKAGASPNKQWGADRWQALVKAVPARWAQMGPPDTDWLDGVEPIITGSFRLAAAVLKASRGFVGPEGGLMHAAAALGVPAVIVFGSYIAPAVTGYDSQVALFTGGAEHPLGCGWRVPCQHCRAAMDSITVERAGVAVAGLLEEACA